MKELKYDQSIGKQIAADTWLVEVNYTFNLRWILDFTIEELISCLGILEHFYLSLTKQFIDCLSLELSGNTAEHGCERLVTDAIRIVAQYLKDSEWFKRNENK